MKVLIIGSGGREHTLAWKLNQSKEVSDLFIAPGNAGTADLGTNVALGVDDFKAIGDFAKENNIGLVLVGPEVPLVLGIHDYFLDRDDLKHIPVIGPQKAAAQLEGSKEFAKEFMMANNIPTAAYQSFGKEDIDQADAFLESLTPPYVLKADGLAAGKGVLILEQLDRAKTAIREMLLDEKFGAASARVVIEEFLTGIELSCFVLTDGDTYKVLPTAKDYKRIGEGDTGLNTGGMGAVSPVPFADKTFMDKVEQRIIIPTVEGLKKAALPYKCFIFIGLIKVGEDPYVIEYNVRMGDPETEVVIPRLDNDFGVLMQAVAQNTLAEEVILVNKNAAATVMLVSGGYPEAYSKGYEISGLEQVKGGICFHAGTRNEGDAIQTNGGRVLAVTAFGEDHKKALANAYKALEPIGFQEMYFRKDLGFDL